MRRRVTRWRRDEARRNTVLGRERRTSPSTRTRGGAARRVGAARGMGRRRRSCGSTSRRCSRRAGWSPGCTTRGRAAGRSWSSWRSTRPASATPESIAGEPWTLAPLTEPWFDRLHFLVWANTYDARAGEPVWWWATQGGRVAAGAVGPRRDGAADDARLRRRPAGVGRRRPRDRPAPAGEPCWCTPSRSTLGGVHARPRSAGAGRRPGPRPAGRGRPRCRRRPASSPPPARARPGCSPSGSATSRRPRRTRPATVLAVAYNKKAQLEMEERTTRRCRARRRAHAPSTRSACGCSPEHRGRSPPVLDEREVRRLVDVAAPRPPRPAGQHRPDRALPRGARHRSASACATRTRSRRRATTSPAWPSCSPPTAPALARARRGRLRRAGLRRRRGAARRRRVPPRRCSARAATCSSTSSRTSRRPTCCCCGCSPLPALDVFGVGDDDQCIYGHAGADPAFLIDFERAVPRRRRAPAGGQLPLPGRGRRRRLDAARLQPPAGPQAIVRRPDQRRRRRARCAVRRARAGRRRRGAGRDGAGLARRPDGGPVVDRRAHPGQLAAARPARRPARGRRAGRLGADARRARAHRPARRARLPAHRHQPGRVRPPRPRRDPAPADPRPAAVVPGAARAPRHVDRRRHSPGSPTRWATRTPRRCCALADDLRLLVDAGRSAARPASCSRSSATTSASARP